MRQNYKANKMRREEAKRKKKEEKRLDRLSRKEKGAAQSPENAVMPSEAQPGVPETPGTV